MIRFSRGLRPFILLLLSIAFLVFTVGTAPAEENPWDCPDCGRTGNTGNFCGGCGHPAPWMEENTGEDGPGQEEQRPDEPRPETAEVPGDTKAGDILTFGAYPQAEDGTDKTPIEWLVLEVRDGKALLLSRHGLDAKPYNADWRDVTWETCSLRAWLNGEFLDRAFSAAERSAILLTDVDNSKAQGYSGWNASGGNDTQDRIFLLSFAEANRYFGVDLWSVKGAKDNTASRVAPTAYAAEAGVRTESTCRTADGAAAGRWWLRSPGIDQSSVACVCGDGSADFNHVQAGTVCVRPAFWLDINSLSN